MKINLYRYLQLDLRVVLSLFLKTNEWKQFDDFAIEKKFQTSIGEHNIILVFYSELLSYTYVYREGSKGFNNDKVRSETVQTPWVACKLEIENSLGDDVCDEILNMVKNYVKKNIKLKPFKDEDAKLGMFARKKSYYIKDWSKYIFYLNPDYPNGWLENHTLS